MPPILGVLLLILSGCASAPKNKRSSSDNQTVEVIGVGATPESARRNAFYNAVEQVVGAIVDASIDVRNNDVIQERILTLSDGYIDDFTVLEPARKVGNVFQEKISASVKRTVLLSSITEHNVAVRASVRGELLYAQAVTQDRVREQAIKMVQSLMADDPRHLKVELMERPTRIDTAELNQAQFNKSKHWIRLHTRVWVDVDHFNSDIITKLVRALDSLGEKRVTRQYWFHIFEDWRSYRAVHTIEDSRFKGTGVPYNRLEGNFRLYEIRGRNAVIYQYTLDELALESVLPSITSRSRRSYVVKFLGANSEILHEAQVKFTIPTFDISRRALIISPALRYTYSRRNVLYWDNIYTQMFTELQLPVPESVLQLVTDVSLSDIR